MTLVLHSMFKKNKIFGIFFRKYHFLFLIAFLLCLPCPAKRELKKVFDIPVSEISKNDDNKPCLITQQFVSDSNKLSKQTFSKNILTNQTIDLVVKTEKPILQTKINNQLPVVRKIHLFILYEQYRI